MFDVFKKSIKWDRFDYTLETGLLARQAQASVVVSCGDTSVLATLVVDNKPTASLGYTPLSVHYQEKSLAAGKIPGGFFKREGRPSEKEILTSRLIDRPLRALLGKGFLHEVQIICTVLSYDKNHDADILAMLASMAAVNLAKLPVPYNIAACRIANIEGKLVLNPTIEELKSSTANVTLAGSNDKIIMIEGDSNEFNEAEMLALLKFGMKSMKPMLDVLQEFRNLPRDNAIDFVTDIDDAVKKKISDLLDSCNAKKTIDAIHKEKDVLLRKKKFDDLKQQVKEKCKLDEDKDVSDDLVMQSLSHLNSSCARDLILSTGKRLDSRDAVTVRDIDCRVNLLPTPHGSSLFTRGNTQALCTVTLGTKDDEQIIDSLQEEYRESFMLHYNFPPFAVGEINPRLGSPNRREIGHGKLAWRAFYRLLPSGDVFPYTIRAVSDVLESNGSSSMATVCGTSMAMWDAAIPLRRHVAGVAMGAVMNDKKAVILSDISGEEDGFGDMDFKVAGTREGITAIQLDVKCEGIDLKMVEQVLAQAHANRMLILDKMEHVISSPRKELKENVLRVQVLKIGKDQIAELIGGGGKTIRGICSASQSKVDIDEDGTVKVYAPSKENMEKAVALINEIVVKPEVGKVYNSQISKLLPFGAVLNIGKNEAWLHISEIADRRIENIEEVLKPDQMLEVRVLSVDERGRARVTARIHEVREAENERPSFRGEGRSGEGRSGDRRSEGRSGDRRSGERRPYENRSSERRSNDGDFHPAFADSSQEKRRRSYDRPGSGDFSPRGRSNFGDNGSGDRREGGPSRGRPSNRDDRGPGRSGGRPRRS